MYDIFFYEDAHGNCPIQEFINVLDAKALTDKQAAALLKKVIYHLNRLSVAGTWSQSNITKHVRGDIWELRPSPYRILFTVWNGEMLLLHFFRKQGQKTPKNEIEIAEKNLEDWISRDGH